MTSEYEFISEREEPGCWRYDFRCRRQDGGSSTHQLRLAWEDYDFWVRDGSVEPERVADAIVRFVLGHAAFDPMPSKVDSSHPRRHDAGADQAIFGLIRDIHP